MTKKENKDGKKKEKNLRIPGLHFDGESCISGLSLVLCGIVCVSEFSEEKAVFITVRGRILIEGNKLEITVFQGKSVEICGKIKKIEFLYSKERKQKFNDKT